MLINDPDGPAARVTGNRLDVNASSFSEAQYVSLKNEFMFFAEQQFTASGTLDGYVQVLANLDPSRVIIVVGIEAEVSVVVAGGSVTLARNPTIDTPNLTNETVLESINLNFGSGKKGLVQSVGHDGVGTGIGGVTDDILFAPIPLDAETKASFLVGGLIVLQQGDELGIKMDTVAATPLCTTGIAYYLLNA